MIKCPNCGFSNDDNCTFCAICGSSVTQDDFYVHNTTNADFSVEELTKKLISKDKQENAKTKSFKKLDKATIAREAARIENKIDKVKKYITSAENNVKEATNSEDDVKVRTKNKPEIKNNSDDKKPEPVATKATKNKISNKNTDEAKAEKSVENTKKQTNNATPVVATANKAEVKPVESELVENKVKVAENKSADTNIKTKNSKTAKAEPEKVNSGKATIKESKPAETEIKTEKNKSVKDEVKPEQIQSQTQTITDSKLYNVLSKFFFDTKDETALFRQDDIDENCNLAMISYIPFLFFVPMIIKPCSGYLRYHGIQGLTMFLSFIVLEFFDIILSAICNSIFNDMVGMILTIIITVAINLAVLLFISIGIANAVKGTARELPIIGRYKFLKPYIY